MTTLSRIIPLNLSWIMTLKIFNITNAVKILDNSNSTTIIISISLKKALKLDKNYLQFHEKYVYEFEDIFIDKLSNKLSSLDASRHHIVLEDEKIFINDRMFRLFIRYWSQMRDFLDEHLIASRIRFSSSYIASETWMIPKNDSTVMPRILHDYRILNVKIIKDHTPLIRQDDIIEWLAKIKIRGKIDLICAYYQILMKIVDIHKIIFKTSFETYEWLVMS